MVPKTIIDGMTCIKKDVDDELPLTMDNEDDPYDDIIHLGDYGDYEALSMMKCFL